MGRQPSWPSCGQRFRRRWPWAVRCMARASGPVAGPLRRCRLHELTILAPRRWTVTAALLVALSTACAGPQGQSTTKAETPARQSRTLTMAVKYEVPDLAPKLPASSGPNTTRRLFNSFLSLIDDTGKPRPYL